MYTCLFLWELDHDYLEESELASLCWSMVVMDYHRSPRASKIINKLFDALHQRPYLFTLQGKNTKKKKKFFMFFSTLLFPTNQSFLLFRSQVCLGNLTFTIFQNVWTKYSKFSSIKCSLNCSWNWRSNWGSNFRSGRLKENLTMVQKNENKKAWSNRTTVAATMTTNNTISSTGSRIKK